MIEVEGLTKRYGDKTAVDGLDLVVRSGTVTGFLGPDRPGTSTTMRMIAGLDAPSSGRVLVNGRDHGAAEAPTTELGILLEARAAHPGRSARNHLRALAQSNGIGERRVDEVLEGVGLADVAGRRVGGSSLGTGQRLGVAAALLGDPRVVVLDEPVNGSSPLTCLPSTAGGALYGSTMDVEHLLSAGGALAVLAAYAVVLVAAAAWRLPTTDA